MSALFLNTRNMNILLNMRSFIRKRDFVVFWAMMPLFLGPCVPSVPVDSVTIRSLPQGEKVPFVLGPEDTIEIVVWKNPSLTRIALIRPDGKITLPLIGEVQAAGLTPAQLSEQIRGRLQEFYKEKPDVFVVVTAINSGAIYILGTVKAAGKYLLHSETSVLQALSLAGGLGEFADADHMVLIRKKGAVETRIKLRYQDIISGQHPEMNLMLQPGDTLVIP